jgi:hypothetical protein
MNKNIPYIIAGTAILVALVSIGSAISMSSRNKAAKAEILDLQTQLANMQTATPDAKPEPEIIYLNNSGDTNEISTLKMQLAEKEAQIRELQTDTDRPSQRNRADRQSLQESMEQMMEEDPEGYAERAQTQSERQEEMRYNLEERAASFMDIDTSMMTEEELANHELLVAKMEEISEITEQFQDPEAAPDSEALREMMALAREAQPLMAVERTVMFKQLGTDLGYTGEDAEVFATNIEFIIDATSMQLAGVRGRGSR